MKPKMAASHATVYGVQCLDQTGRRTSGPVKLAYCWAHARHKLKEVHDRDGSPIAGEGLKRIAKFYKIEAAIRGNRLNNANPRGRNISNH